MMHQSARHEVLSGLGINSWYCKYSITNAAETPAQIYQKVKCIEELPDEVGASPLVGIHAAVSGSASAKLAVKAHLGADIATKSVKGVVSNEALIDEPFLADNLGVIKNIVPELTLSTIIFGSITVISEQSESGDGILERVLLENIISVIAGEKTASIYNDSVLSWPVFKSRALVQEQSPYFKSVARRWLEMHSWSECSHVFYFGASFSTLEPALLLIKDEQGLDYKLVSCKDALGYLLGSPIKKKSLWSLFSKTGVISE